jgi:hypothetical protein
MSSNAISDLLDLGWHVLLFGEVDELLSTHLDAKVALCITTVDSDRTHAHGPNSSSVL